MSGDPLLSFEEFSAGNYTVGRGYDPGALLGDSGIGFQAELRYGSAVPARRRRDFAVEPYRLLRPGLGLERGRALRLTAGQELSSVGGGVRAAYGDRFRLDVTARRAARPGAAARAAAATPACSSRSPPACGHGDPDDRRRSLLMLGLRPLGGLCVAGALRERRRPGLQRQPEDRRRRRRLRPRHARGRNDHHRHRQRDHQLDPDVAGTDPSCPPATPRPSSTAPTTPNFVVLNRIIADHAGPLRRHRAQPARGSRGRHRAPGGTVIFSSPGGIIVGPTAVFDVGNLVLTSLNVVDDGAGNFGDRRPAIISSTRSAAFPNAAVVTEPGAQINALNQGSPTSPWSRRR